MLLWWRVRYVIVYLLVGIIWSSVVGLARLYANLFGPFRRSLFWLPMTAILWPWSMSISFREVWHGALSEEAPPANELYLSQLFVIAALVSAVFGLVRACS
jgi:hypothetical protein